jgi:sugar/nucleoside kinase (ribokinase family)
MTDFDLAVVGGPFLDLTFEGLPEPPAPGREVYARALHATPGGTGMIAIGAARLGLRTALVSPIGRDPAGESLRRLFEAEGVRWIGRDVEATPVTVIFPGPDGAAMATHAPGEEPMAEEVASVRARAVVVSLGRLPLRPPDARVYVVTGPGEIGRFDGIPSSLSGAEALIVNEGEARRLTGETDPEVAALALANHADSAVVTLGPRGAVGANAGEAARAEPPPVEAVDPTGAGDLFVAAYAWADLGGRSFAERLRWATLYASLSVGSHTALAGARSLDQLVDAGRPFGLAP